MSMSDLTFENWTAGNPIPTNAKSAGFDADKTEIYIGYAQYKGHTLPVKIKPIKNAAYVAYEGEEVRITECKVICSPNLVWKSVNNGSIPKDVSIDGKEIGFKEYEVLVSLKN